MWVFCGGRCFSDFDREMVETSCELPVLTTSEFERCCEHYQSWLFTSADLHQKHINQRNTCLIEITVRCFTVFELSNEFLIMIETEIQVLGAWFSFGFYVLREWEVFCSFGRGIREWLVSNPLPPSLKSHSLGSCHLDTQLVCSICVLLKWK